MFTQMVNPVEAAEILALAAVEELDSPPASDFLRSTVDGSEKKYAIHDLVVYVLARALLGLGVSADKARPYAAAVLEPRMCRHDSGPVDWVENQTQELFCLIADGELARIFLRSNEGRKELDIGAVKPVLFPTTLCEVNVFRVIRPVIMRARKLLKLRPCDDCGA
jgi:hypothetical protein